MLSPHTCLFPEGTRAGLDIQMRSEENFHLYTILLLLRREEEKKGQPQNFQQEGLVWLPLGPAKVQEPSVCSLPKSSLEGEGHSE